MASMEMPWFFASNRIIDIQYLLCRCKEEGFLAVESQRI